jgi:hypothetical protein
MVYLERQEYVFADLSHFRLPSLFFGPKLLIFLPLEYNILTIYLHSSMILPPSHFREGSRKEVRDHLRYGVVGNGARRARLASGH